MFIILASIKFILECQKTLKFQEHLYEQISRFICLICVTKVGKAFSRYFYVAIIWKSRYTIIICIKSCITGSSHSDKEVDALTPEKSVAMRGSTAASGTVLVAPGGATPTITMPERKRKRKGKINSKYDLIMVYLQNLLTIYLWCRINYLKLHNYYYMNIDFNFATKAHCIL